MLSPTRKAAVEDHDRLIIQSGPNLDPNFRVQNLTEKSKKTEIFSALFEGAVLGSLEVCRVEKGQIDLNVTDNLLREALRLHGLFVRARAQGEEHEFTIRCTLHCACRALIGAFDGDGRVGNSAALLIGHSSSDRCRRGIRLGKNIDRKQQ